MSRMSTLREIAIDRANKQPQMVDQITEAAPILEQCKWIPATHGLSHVAERLTEVEGAGFVELDSPIPSMRTGSELVRTDLHLLAGQMEVPTIRAMKFGGPEKYFANKQELILKQAGMSTERRLVFDNWLEAALQSGNVTDAGGTGKGWFLLAVRFDPDSNVGLYDPDQFDSGRLMKIDLPYGGQEHELSSPGYVGVLGYKIVYRGIFGWQILDAKRTCAAIVNIDETSHPSPAQIDDMLSDVRAEPGTTVIMCSPKGKTHAINPHKLDHIHMVSGDTDARTRLDTWNGINILSSYNILDKINHLEV